MSNIRSTRLIPPSISIIVPVYNSEATLDKLTTRIKAVLVPVVKHFEIILVNDGSQDSSWEVITRLTEQNEIVRGLNLMRNYGQHNALLAGIQGAQYEIVVTIDDDLQHPPEEIPRLISKLSEGYDVVYGRAAARCHNAWRNIASRILKSTLKVVLGAEMGAQSSAFRAFWTILRSGFANFTDTQLSIDVLLSWSAVRVTHILVDHQERRAGKSGYTFRKLMLLAFNVLTG